MINQFKLFFTSRYFLLLLSFLLMMIAAPSVIGLLTIISIFCIHFFGSLLFRYLPPYLNITPFSTSIKTVVLSKGTKKKTTLLIDTKKPNIHSNDPSFSTDEIKPLLSNTNSGNNIMIKKKPSLSIDTSKYNDKNGNQEIGLNSMTTSMILNSLPTKPLGNRKRHYSISTVMTKTTCITNNEDVFPYQETMASLPLLSYSPTSSVSSFNSISWNPDDSKRSQVEEMIYLFETGGFQRERFQHRRYSVDSYNLQQQKRKFIRERKFEYRPIAGEWKKRVIANNSPVCPTVSQSTPTQSKRRITPIPEQSKSLVA